MARMFEIAVWSAERRTKVQDDHRAAVAAALNAQPDAELASKLDKAIVLGNELANIFSGNPRLDSPRLKMVADELDLLAKEFEVASDEFQDSKPLLSVCLFQAARSASNLAFYVHFPEGDDRPPIDPPTPPAVDDSTLDERACAAKVAHAEWTDQEVADHIDCRRETLFKPNMKKYKAAKAALKATRLDFVSSGSTPDRRRRIKPVESDDE